MFQSHIDEIRRQIQAWNRQLHTPFGKNYITKTLPLSKLTYYTISLPNPKGTWIDELQDLTNQFIWGKHMPMGIERAKLPIKQGGFNQIKVEEFWKSLKIEWFVRAHTSEDIWAKLLKNDLSKIGIDSIEELINEPSQNIFKIANKIKHPFWKEAIMALSCASQNFFSSSKKGLIKIPIWK